MALVPLSKIGRRCRACEIDPGTNRICPGCKKPIHRRCHAKHVVEHPECSVEVQTMRRGKLR